MHSETDALASLFQELTGAPPVSIEALKGDASNRRIYRLNASASSVIGIMGPNLKENRAFLGFARSFRKTGLHVPEIYSVSTDERLYLQEDLGDTLFSDWQQKHRKESGVDAVAMDMYAAVLDQLLRFQFEAADNIDYSLCYQTREFDEAAMLYDVQYFRNNFLLRLSMVQWNEKRFTLDTRHLIDILAGVPRTGFLYRDFQSRNVMLRDCVPWFIDFQSGRRGAPHYDLASMLYDSKGGLSADQKDELIDRHIRNLSSYSVTDEAEFRKIHTAFAVLRLMQALGAFANLALNKGKPDYLEFIPSRLQALAEIADTADILRETPYLQELILRLAE